MKILFICEANVSRSQMAAAILKNELSGCEVRSAGLKLSEAWEFPSHELTLEAMSEIDLKIPQEPCKLLDESSLKWADEVVVLCEQKKFEEQFADKYNAYFFFVNDTANASINEVRNTRDKLRSWIDLHIVQPEKAARRLANKLDDTGYKRILVLSSTTDTFFVRSVSEKGFDVELLRHEEDCKLANSSFQIHKVDVWKEDFAQDIIKSSPKREGENKKPRRDAVVIRDFEGLKFIRTIERQPPSLLTKDKDSLFDLLFHLKPLLREDGDGLLFVQVLRPEDPANEPFRVDDFKNEVQKLFLEKGFEYSREFGRRSFMVFRKKPVVYQEYVGVKQVLESGKPETANPDEHVFIQFHKICELYFDLIRHELEQLLEDEAAEKRGNKDFWLEKLRRVNEYFRILGMTMPVLMKTLDRNAFLTGFRGRLSPASGWQSFQYRKLELMLTSMEKLKGQNEPEAKFENLYWQSGEQTVSGDMVRNFLNLHEDDLREISEYYKSRNLMALIAASAFKDNPEILAEVGRIDHTLVRFRNAHKGLAKEFIPEDEEGTGGSNWQEYLERGNERGMFDRD